jgi:energy-coupling factor transporter ATP-binding protein EcfA2
MAIERVEIQDFLVFKGEFSANFCPGVNVLIGGNGTGKTTLMKVIYEKIHHDTYPSSPPKKENQNASIVAGGTNISHPVYIPEKDILEHAKGLLPFIMQKQTGFSTIYVSVLVAAQDVPTQVQSDTQKSIGQKIARIIGGEVRWDKGDGSFYTLKTDGSRIPFANEASGYKKFGFLGLLVSSGQLEPGTVLFWDEPENSLNPELVPVLVDILLELSRNGVQIFIATHSEILTSYFAANRQSDDAVMFYSLYKDGERIKVDASDRFDLLSPNNLTTEPVKLYEKEIAKGLGGNG